jgi:hypothetical protein
LGPEQTLWCSPATQEEHQTKVDQGEPCPYVYAKYEFKPLKPISHRGDDEKWSFEAGQPRSHYHLYCSEKDNHAGYAWPDAMKYYCQDLPPSLQKVIVGTPCA